MIYRTIRLLLLEIFYLLFDIIKWASGNSGFVLRNPFIKNIFADCGENISRDSNVLFGPNVVLMVSNNILSSGNIPIFRHGCESGKIIKENDRWIGANVVALPNVSIGNGTVSSVCTVLKKNIGYFFMVSRAPTNVISKPPE